MNIFTLVKRVVNPAKRPEKEVLADIILKSREHMRQVRPPITPEGIEGFYEFSRDYRMSHAEATPMEIYTACKEEHPEYWGMEIPTIELPPKAPLVPPIPSQGYT